jgi:hypothetical protein
MTSCCRILMQGRQQQNGCQPAAWVPASSMVASNSIDKFKNLDASNSQQHSVSIVSPPIARDSCKDTSSTRVELSHPPPQSLIKGLRVIPTCPAESRSCPSSLLHWTVSTCSRDDECLYPHHTPDSALLPGQHRQIYLAAPRGPLFPLFSLVSHAKTSVLLD